MQRLVWNYLFLTWKVLSGKGKCGRLVSKFCRKLPSDDGQRETRWIYGAKNTGLF